MPNVFGYLRFGPGEQDDSDGVVKQQRAIQDHFADTFAEKGFDWAGYHIDQDDAHALPLLSRPAGRQLNVELSQGDGVVFPRFDRAFRDGEDFLNTVDTWFPRGIRVSLLDVGMCDIGAEVREGLEVVGSLLAADRVRHSDTMRRVYAARRGSTRQVNQHAPLGYRWVGRKGRRRMVVDEQERATMARIVDLRQQGDSWYRIAAKLLRERATTREGRQWGPARVRRAHDAELSLRAEAMDGLRKCSICGIRKPLDRFYPDSSRRDGRRGECSTCRLARRRQTKADRQKQDKDRALLQLHRAVKRNRISEAALGSCAEIIDLLGGVRGLAAEFVRAFHCSRPGSLQQIRLIETVVDMTKQLSDRCPVDPDISSLSDEELEQTLLYILPSMASEEGLNADTVRSGA